MSQPIIRHSIKGATGVGVGSAVDALGHYHTGLFVTTSASDPLTLNVELEVTPDGTHWATANDINETAVEVSMDEMTTDPDSGQETGHVKTPGLYGLAFRARITGYDAAGTVDAWVIIGGNAGQGRKPTGRKGPVTDLGV